MRPASSAVERRRTSSEEDECNQMIVGDESYFNKDAKGLYIGLF